MKFLVEGKQAQVSFNKVQVLIVVKGKLSKSCIRLMRKFHDNETICTYLYLRSGRKWCRMNFVPISRNFHPYISIHIHCPCSFHTGITNHEEYSLVRELPDDEKEKTLTLRRDRSIAKDQKKLDELKKKLHTDDERELLQFESFVDRLY